MGRGMKQGHVLGVQGCTRCMLFDLGGTLEPSGDPELRCYRLSEDFEFRRELPYGITHFSQDIGERHGP